MSKFHSLQRVAVTLLSLMFLVILPMKSGGAGLQPNDIARLLAGMRPSPGSAAEAVTREPGWQTHAKAMDRAWAGLETRQLSRIRAWSARNLKSTRPTLLYMFSGPDAVYANAFFGNADTIIMAGLEPVGRVPQFTDDQVRNLSSGLAGLRSSLRALLSYSFFRTEAMRSDLRSRTFQGTLPIILAFLARAEKSIHTVQLVELDTDGRLVEDAQRSTGPFDGPARGAEIVFSGADGKQRKLYYFSTDLSDSGIERGGFSKFVQRQGRVDALVKSASYLMLSGGFSRARQLLLEKADQIVQDDSGIPITYFNQQEWELQPFGRYRGPIAIFPGRYQSRLAELFRRPAGQLDFSIGYRWRRNESNLLVAVRRATGQSYDPAR